MVMPNLRTSQEWFTVPWESLYNLDIFVLPLLLSISQQHLQTSRSVSRCLTRSISTKSPTQNPSLIHEVSSSTRTFPITRNPSPFWASPEAKCARNGVKFPTRENATSFSTTSTTMNARKGVKFLVTLAIFARWSSFRVLCSSVKCVTNNLG